MAADPGLILVACLLGIFIGSILLDALLPLVCELAKMLWLMWRERGSDGR